MIKEIHNRGKQFQLLLIRDILCIHNRIRFITLIIIWNIIVLSNDGRISFILENKILQNFLSVLLSGFHILQIGNLEYHMILLLLWEKLNQIF